jgi:hypothetical protein
MRPMYNFLARFQKIPARQDEGTGGKWAYTGYVL